MACRSCGQKSASGSRGTSSATKAIASAQQTSQSRSRSAAVSGSGDDMIMVQENSGNRGSHGVIGARSRRSYGRHSHGDQFLMLRIDQLAQPMLYIDVSKAAEPSTPQPVELPVSNTTTVEELPPPSPDQKQLDQIPIVEDDEGIDIGMLTLQQIKNLGLDVESAAAALEAERLGKGRKSVIDYLSSIE